MTWPNHWCCGYSRSAFTPAVLLGHQQLLCVARCTKRVRQVVVCPALHPAARPWCCFDGPVQLLSSIIRPLCSLRGLWQLPLSGEGVEATISCSEYGVFPWLGCLPGVCMWPRGHSMHEGLRLRLTPEWHLTATKAGGQGWGREGGMAHS